VEAPWRHRFMFGNSLPIDQLTGSIFLWQGEKLFGSER
jgi:hypothetical protein